MLRYSDFHDIQSCFVNQYFPFKEIHHKQKKKLVDDHNPMSPSLFAKRIEQMIALKVSKSMNHIDTGFFF